MGVIFFFCPLKVGIDVFIQLTEIEICSYSVKTAQSRVVFYGGCDNV